MTTSWAWSFTEDWPSVKKESLYLFLPKITWFSFIDIRFVIDRCHGKKYCPFP